MSSHQRKLPPNPVIEDRSLASQKTEPLEAPWWQLYSALIIVIGIGVVMAVNAPTLLTNPWVLLFGVFIFVGFVMVWSYRHSRELEAEPWHTLDGSNASEHGTKGRGTQE